AAELEAHDAIVAHWENGGGYETFIEQYNRESDKFEVKTRAILDLIGIKAAQKLTHAKHPTDIMDIFFSIDEMIALFNIPDTRSNRSKLKKDLIERLDIIAKPIFKITEYSSDHAAKKAGILNKQFTLLERGVRQETNGGVMVTLTREYTKYIAFGYIMAYPIKLIELSKAHGGCGERRRNGERVYLILRHLLQIFGINRKPDNARDYGMISLKSICKELNIDVKAEIKSRHYDRMYNDIEEAFRIGVNENILADYELVKAREEPLTPEELRKVTSPKLFETIFFKYTPAREQCEAVDAFRAIPTAAKKKG
ncbi:MAG: hypothetical protein J6333_02270, partial [Planctomycetes bacterium]|nr:hypothetical protein [Planctomycetota bacterium]